MKTLFSNKLFFLIFFLLISAISSENRKENSLAKKSNEEGDNKKAEKSSENRMERKRKEEGNERNSKDMPEKSDKEERKKEDENKSEDKPKRLNENEDKKNDENNSKDKPENSNEEKDKNKDENNKDKKDEEDDDENKKNKKKKKKKNKEEDDNKEDDSEKGEKKEKRKKRKKKKGENEEKEEKEDKGEKKENGEEEEKGKKKNKKNKNKKSEAILLGFDKYEENKDEDNISFNIYFIPVQYYIKANKLKVPLKIKLKESRLRSLKDEKQIIECKKKYKKGEKKIRFRCQFEKKDRKIEKIEVDVNKFKFIGQQVKIKSCSPLAMKYIKNIKKVGKEKQFKNKIYVLENAELKQNEKNFNIIGKIKDKDFDKEEVTLSFLNSKKKVNKIDCKIMKKKGKYNFECEPKKNINGNFDGAYGDLEDKNIVINFKKDEDSEINFIVEKKEENEEKKEKKEKKKKKDDDDDNDENKNKKKEEDNNDNDNENNENKKESNREIRRKLRKKKEEKDDDLQFVYEKNVKIDILIYICIGFIILLLITLAYNCIVQANNKESSKSYLDSNSMDTVKLSTQSNE